MKRISSDSICSVVHLNTTTAINHFDKDYLPRRYVVCTYDNQWHIGNVVERSDANSDLLINFIERNDEMSLLWPRKADKCWVPFLHVLCSVDVPLAEGQSARQHTMTVSFVSISNLNKSTSGDKLS